MLGADLASEQQAAAATESALAAEAAMVEVTAAFAGCCSCHEVMLALSAHPLCVAAVAGADSQLRQLIGVGWMRRATALLRAHGIHLFRAGSEEMVQVRSSHCRHYIISQLH